MVDTNVDTANKLSVWREKNKKKTKTKNTTRESRREVEFICHQPIDGNPCVIWKTIEKSLRYTI